MAGYDCIVVGAGLAGGILARKLAEEKNKKVLIIERRDHIAGNMYDFDNEYGIKVQRYGPHTFHTNIEAVYQFLTRFCEPESYKTRCEAVIDGISTPSPFNFKTIDQFYPKDEAKELKEKLLAYYGNRGEVTVIEMLDAEDEDIRKHAEFLFEKDYRPYTSKQWNLKPEEIDSSVLKRVPIVLSYRDTYFDDKYEFMPKGGFTTMYERMVEHPRITIQLGEDAFKYIDLDTEQRIVFFNDEKVPVIYTGAIDELFGYMFGELPYRSLDFEFKSYKMDSFQNTAIVAYPQAEGYTRITEYTKMPMQDGKGITSVAYEFPVTYDVNADIRNEPYYPVLTQQSQMVYERYKKYAERFENLILCGRLADFKYYNMDILTERALKLYEEIKDRI